MKDDSWWLWDVLRWLLVAGLVVLGAYLLYNWWQGRAARVEPTPAPQAVVPTPVPFIPGPTVITVATPGFLVQGQPAIAQGQLVVLGTPLAAAALIPSDQAAATYFVAPSGGGAAYLPQGQVLPQQPMPPQQPFQSQGAQRPYQPMPSHPGMPSQAGPGCMPRSYVVRPGDTVFGLAMHFGVAPQDIVAANDLANPNFIAVGQMLTIPCGGEPMWRDP